MFVTIILYQDELIRLNLGRGVIEVEFAPWSLPVPLPW